jgi:DnaJ-domain-containing protein 1
VCGINGSGEQKSNGGVCGKVTFEEVKRQYRNRMAEYHPDKVADLGTKLQELAEEETK